MDEVPIFEGLAAGWVDDDVGLFFLLDKVAEGGDITRSCAALSIKKNKPTESSTQPAAMHSNIDNSSAVPMETPGSERLPTIWDA